jgi:superoxide dismutase, Fe-Mn family
MVNEPKPYVAKDYSHIKGLKGITDEQIAEHLKLYNGYVNRTNALLKKTYELCVAGKQGESEFQELKRRQGWEFNGMRLHEYYFDQFAPRGGNTLTDKNAFGSIVTAQYGSVDNWHTDMVGVAKSPGIGWAICFQDPINGAILNTWIEQHDGGHLIGCKPLLIVDIFEHAFTVYLKPTERAKYLDDFHANIDWEVIAGRTKTAAIATANAM